MSLTQAETYSCPPALSTPRGRTAHCTNSILPAADSEDLKSGCNHVIVDLLQPVHAAVEGIRQLSCPLQQHQTRATLTAFRPRSKCLDWHHVSSSTSASLSRELVLYGAPSGPAGSSIRSLPAESMTTSTTVLAWSTEVCPYSSRLPLPNGPLFPLFV
jgi:hypothetical protein